MTLLRTAAVLLVINILGQASTLATTVVGLHTSDEVVIAADSRTRWPETGTIGSRCKILTHGNIAVALSGLTRDTESAFDADRIARTLLQTGGTVAQLASSFERAVFAGLTAALRRMRQALPDHFRSTYGRHREALAIQIAGFENGAARLSMRSFSVHRDRDGTPWPILAVRRDCPGADCPDAVAVVVHGRSGAPSPFLAATKNVDRSLASVAGDIVQLEIEADPSRVGPPIDIVQIDEGGLRWVQRQDGCSVDGQPTS